jgi:disulfide bond formation protein DsbB
MENLSLNSNRNSFLLYLAWTVAVVATAGSLFFSEVMELPPCVLCWYQRIAMYPLVAVIAVGIILRDSQVKFYALPLALGGLLIAVYHNLLYYGIIPESITPCQAGISCTSRQIEWFGFITIPLMSLTAFLIISLCLAVYQAKIKEK